MKFYIYNTEDTLVFVSADYYRTPEEAKQCGDKFLLSAQMCGYRSWTTIKVK